MKRIIVLLLIGAVLFVSGCNEETGEVNSDASNSNDTTVEATDSQQTSGHCMASFLLLYTTWCALFTAMVNAGRGGSFRKGLGLGVAFAVLSVLAVWGFLQGLP